MGPHEVPPRLFDWSSRRGYPKRMWPSTILITLSPTMTTQKQKRNAVVSSIVGPLTAASGSMGTTHETHPVPMHQNRVGGVAREDHGHFAGRVPRVWVVRDDHPALDPRLEPRISRDRRTRAQRDHIPLTQGERS